MPRKAKTQRPQSPGLEAGSAYGEVQDNIAAQEAIPLPQTNNLPAPVNQAPATPAPLPVEAAQAFTPDITPLLAPGAGGIGSPQMISTTPKQRSGELLQSWADATGDPLIAQAAMQLLAQQ